MNEGKANSDDLVLAAAAARRRAYAPYSHFAVGAAVLVESGAVYTGANVENASYGLTICAERAAVFAAVAAGERRVVAVAVVTEGPDAVPPCGACRQVILEFGPKSTIVSVAGSIRMTWSLAELLPHPFGHASFQSETLPPDSQK